MNKFTISMLGDISEYITSGSRDWSKYYSDTGALFVRTQDINKNRLDTSSSARVALPYKVEGKRTRLKKGDLLVTITGANVGKCAVVDWDIEEAYVSQSVALIRLKCPDAAKFIYHQLTCKDGDQTYLEKAAYGLGRPVLNLTNMREVPIVLASPEIQNEIVAEIEKQFSRLGEVVTALKRVQGNLKRYKAAVLKAAVEGKLTEQWRKDHSDFEPADQLLKRILAERRAKWEAEELAKMKAKGIKPKDDSWKKKYKEPAGPDTANLPELPEGWVWSKSDQLFSFVTSGSRGWAGYYSETGPVFLRMGNLDHDTIRLDLTDIQRVQPPSGSEGLRTHVCAGDILVSITADVGMVGMVPEGFEEAYINQHVALARPLAAINSSFLAWHLASKTGQDQFKDLQRGATKVGLGLDDIKSVNVPIPPVKEQQAILEEIDRRLSVTEELEATIETNLKRAERLRQTILKQAFSDGFGG